MAAKRISSLTDWAFEVNGDERAQVSLGVLIGIVVSGEATTWIILDWSDVLQIGGVLTLARHPDGIQLKATREKVSGDSHHSIERATHSKLIFTGSLVDEFLEIPRHVRRQPAGVVVVMRGPSEDLVQLEENTGRAFVVVVVVLLNARSPRLDVDIADLAPWRLLPVVAVVDVLTASRNRSRCFVCCK